MQNIGFLLCFSLSVGILVSLLVVRRADLQSQFFRINSAIGCALIGIAYLLGQSIVISQISAPLREIFWMGMVAFVYSISVRWLPVFVERLLLLIATSWGAWILWRILPWLNSDSIWRVADFLTVLSSGVVMGLALVAMNVGHSYLSSAKLSSRPLKNTTRALQTMVLIRFVSIVILLLGAFLWSPRVSSEIQSLFQFHNITLLMIGLIRILFGIIGPLILVTLAIHTVKMRSMQSATGILYAVLAMILAGEASGIFLTLNTKLPL